VAPPAQIQYEISEATGNRTAIVAPGSAWAQVSRQIPQPNGDFQLVHQIIPDRFLTDALRRGDF
jgi:hypothetical protein